jgi:Tfp pilus assembly protein PilV
LITPQARSRLRSQRGVSLIEALVAIAIMAFGMLGLAGLQSSLRANADISKQRSEAVRIAQEAIEQVRAYSSFGAVPGKQAYGQIQSVGATVVPSDNSNTVFTRTVTVNTLASNSLAARKEVVVTVSWVDRLNTNPPPSVTLSTVVAGVPPELQASLATPPGGTALRNPGGRHGGIPRQARLLEGGISIFKPPQPTGSDTVVWVFDNRTALFKPCTVAVGSTVATLERADLGEACLAAAFDQQLLSGYVRFADVSQTASVSQALLPTGTGLNLDIELTLTSTGHAGDPVCFDTAPATEAEAALPGLAAAYYCAVPLRPAGTWAGRTRIRPQAWEASADPAWQIQAGGPGHYKVCRYTTMTGDGFSANDGKTNADHPLDYAEAALRWQPRQALTQQNFLVIKAADTCPAHSPSAQETVNANTRLHQDGGGTYTNPA